MDIRHSGGGGQLFLHSPITPCSSPFTPQGVMPQITMQMLSTTVKLYLAELILLPTLQTGVPADAEVTAQSQCAVLCLSLNCILV